MTEQTWHQEFNPQKFLSYINLEQLLEKNKAYNDSVSNSDASCLLCGETKSKGILLNDKSLLCEQCYSEVSLISYPEKYEALRRNFITASKSRQLAWKSFQEKYRYESEDNNLLFIGFASVILAFVTPFALLLTAVLLVIGFVRYTDSKKKIQQWHALKTEWEGINPEPVAPELKHFHDPSAIISERDKLIVKIFNH